MNTFSSLTDELKGLVETKTERKENEGLFSY